MSCSRCFAGGVFLLLVTALTAAAPTGAAGVDVIRPGVGREVCNTARRDHQGQRHKLRLCVKRGMFAHDEYRLVLDGKPVLAGIDDATTDGLRVEQDGLVLSLQCTPVEGMYQGVLVETARDCRVAWGEHPLWEVRVLFE